MKSKPSLVIGLLCLALAGLAGCGGDVATPAATPVPTSAPPAATSTRPAPTNTAPVPTNTVPAPTSTMPAPTNTAPPAATNTPAAQPASTADLALIHDALTATAGLKSFHFTQLATGPMVPKARQIEGDYVAAAGLYAKGEMGGAQGEFLKAGTQNYKKDAGGNWVPWTDPSETAPQTAQQTMGSFFGFIASIVPLSDLQSAGTETLDGISTQHFAGTIPLANAPGGAAFAGLTGLPPAGTVAVWIDPQAKVLHKLEIHLDTGPAVAAALAKLATPGVPPATPGAPAVLTVAMTLTRPNDPAISVPAAPAAGAAGPTAPVAATTTGPQPATAAQVAQISQALTGTAALKSFHYTQVIAGSTYTQPWNIAGDYVAPDQEYIKGQFYGLQGEFLSVGTRNYQKDGQGKWVAWTVPGATPQTPQQLIGTFFNGLASLAAIAEFQDTGTPDTLDGVRTQHFAGTIPLGKFPGVGAPIAALTGLPPAGTIAVWIDPQTGYLHKVEVRLDTGPAVAAATAKLTAPGAPTPVPAPAYTFTVDMTVSRQNDPALSVPAPGGATAAPTATPAPGGAAGPTPTQVTLPLTAGADHTSPAKALAFAGPTHVNLTLTSPKDVVYFSFKSTVPAAVGLWFYNAEDAVGTLQVQLLDPSGQKELNVDTLKPGEQASLSMALPDPGVYLIKVTAAGLTKVPTAPVQVELNSLDPSTP